MAVVLGSLIVLSADAETKHHWNPDITRAADGFFYVTWFNLTDKNIQLQKISAAGTIQWTNSTQVNTLSITYPTGWEPEPQIAISGSNLYVVWGRGFEELRMMKLDTNGIPAWPTEVLVNSQPSETIGHDMAVDSNGFIYIHYQRYGPYGRASFLAKVNSNGTKVWTNDVSSGEGSNQWDQRMAISADNAIYTINAYRIDVSTVSTWLQRLNTGGTTVWNNVDVGLSEASVTTDASNNVVVSGKSGNIVYMKRYDPNGNPLGGSTVVSSNASLPLHTGVAADASGNTYVTWEDKRSNYGYDYEVYANRIDATGNWAWPSNMNANIIDLSEQQHSSTVTHPSGGIMVVWDQSTPGGGWINIRANRLDANGARSFDPDVDLHAFGNQDVDGDGMADAWEAEHFGSSLDCAAGDDVDEDGMNNYREYVADTNPMNATSVFRVAVASGSATSVLFNSSAARTYRLDGTTNLATPIIWTPAGDTVTGHGGPMSLTITGTAPRLYYRVRVQAP